MISLRASSLLALLFLAVHLASAHEIWIEDTPQGELYLRFAEYGEDYEKSPGQLDAVTQPFAWRPTADIATSPEAAPEKAPAENDPLKGRGIPAREQRDIRAGKVDAFATEKKSDGYLLVGATADTPAQAETGFTVMGQPGDPEKPARKPYFYARWQPPGSGSVKPSLNFDVVPTANPGEACVYLRGKPVAGAKLKLYPPAEHEVELTSDASGLVHFEAKKPGLYLLSAARQREVINGFYGGKPYDVASHNCSLSWRQK